MAVPLRDVLSGVLQHSAGHRQSLDAIERRWKRLVGPELAEHTKPVSLRRGRLVIHVEAPGDSFALSYQRARLLKRLQSSTKGAVTELVIRAGG